EFARQRLGQRFGQRFGRRVQLHLADLGRPLDFLSDESFDIVISPLALDYVADWGAAFKTFHRVLRGKGVFVFSANHPLSDFLIERMTNYFEREQMVMEWRGFDKPVTVPFYRRPLSEMVNALIDSGFIVDCLLEPRPTEEFKVADP